MPGSSRVLHEFRLKSGGDLFDGVVEVRFGLFEPADDVVVVARDGNRADCNGSAGQNTADDRTAVVRTPIFALEADGTDAECVPFCRPFRFSIG